MSIKRRRNFGELGKLLRCGLDLHHLNSHYAILPPRHFLHNSSRLHHIRSGLINFRSPGHSQMLLTDPRTVHAATPINYSASTICMPLSLNDHFLAKLLPLNQKAKNALQALVQDSSNATSPQLGLLPSQLLNSPLEIRKTRSSPQLSYFDITFSCNEL